MLLRAVGEGWGTRPVGLLKGCGRKASKQWLSGEFGIVGPLPACRDGTACESRSLRPFPNSMSSCWGCAFPRGIRAGDKSSTVSSHMLGVKRGKTALNPSPRMCGPARPTFTLVFNNVKADLSPSIDDFRPNRIRCWSGTDAWGWGQP